MIFRDGPTGRRSGLAGGPDCWEVVAGLIGGDVGAADRIERAVTEFGLTLQQVNAALDYYADFALEIDAEIAANEAAADEAEDAWRRRQDLLSVKLLLDVHHSRLAAERLRASNYDVVAASDFPGLKAMLDEDLLRHARTDDRAVVTENVKDFDRIVRAWVATGERHAGVAFTSPRRFHRGRSAYPEDLVVALTRLLTAPSSGERDWVHWLE